MGPSSYAQPVPSDMAMGQGSMPPNAFPPASMMRPTSMPPTSMPPTSMPPTSMPPAGGPPLSMAGQYVPNIQRPQMSGAGNPPIVSGNIQYGPSYKMQYQKRSTADKSAVKYTGFLPLEGVYEEDTCRIG